MTQNRSASLTPVMFHGRQAVQVENSALRITLTSEGGHIAELFHKAAEVSPLWIPPWPSIEPSTYSRDKHPEYGDDAESKLLAGIMGHNLCLDFFGPPSADEAAAGLTVHGEASVAPYEFESIGEGVLARCQLKEAHLSFERRLHLNGSGIDISETVENHSAFDRPIGWQEHVTLGPPFLEKGSTQFRAPVAKAATLEGEKVFDWPALPSTEASRDLRTYTNADRSGGYTTQLLNPEADRSYFLAFSPRYQLVLGYVWTTGDFHWLGMWEENCSRQSPPWNGRTNTLGLEFGVSPFPESRRQMIARQSFLGVPAYRWLPAKSHATVSYRAALVSASAIPESLAEFEGLLK